MSVFQFFSIDNILLSSSQQHVSRESDNSRKEANKKEKLIKKPFSVLKRMSSGHFDASL
jgi:hypothetical protein